MYSPSYTNGATGPELHSYWGSHRRNKIWTHPGFLGSPRVHVLIRHSMHGFFTLLYRYMLGETPISWFQIYLANLGVLEDTSRL